MIIGRIAFGLIIFVGSMLWMISLMFYGDGIWNGKDIPDWLMGLGGAFFPPICNHHIMSDPDAFWITLKGDQNGSSFGSCQCI